MDYKIIKQEQAPIEIQEWIRENIDVEGQQIITKGKITYVLLTRGVKNTGGYDIKVELTEEEKLVEVGLEYLDPKENEAQIQVVTNPYIIIEFTNNNNKEVLIRKDLKK